MLKLFLFVLTLRSTTGYSTEPIFTRSILETEFDYLNKFKPNEENKFNSICDLPKSEKHAICETIFSYGMYANLLKLYFNKTAWMDLVPACEEKVVYFFINQSYNYKEVRQRMFPCYGRHQPMRTSYKSDDHFDTIYLSDALENNAIFVYIHRKTAKSDSYTLLEKVSDTDVQHIVPRLVYYHETGEETNSLNKWSYNGNGYEIEVNYLREILGKDERIPDKVCELESRKKLMLCKLLMSRGLYKIRYNVTVDESVFQSESTKCVEKHLYIKYEPDHKNNYVLQNMYPCYGSPIKAVNPEAELFYKTMIWFSGGSRPSSIAIYMRHRNDSRLVMFIELVENFNMSSLDAFPS